jgi:hypothetical protein
MWDIDIVLRRFAEYHDLEGAFGRWAVTERAKGILMERHSIDANAAFDMLREHSRGTNRKLVDIASAVVDGYALLPKQAGLAVQHQPPGTRHHRFGLGAAGRGGYLARSVGVISLIVRSPLSSCSRIAASFSSRFCASRSLCVLTSRCVPGGRRYDVRWPSRSCSRRRPSAARRASTRCRS